MRKWRFKITTKNFIVFFTKNTEIKESMQDGYKNLLDYFRIKY